MDTHDVIYILFIDIYCIFGWVHFSKDELWSLDSLELTKGKRY